MKAVRCRTVNRKKCWLLKAANICPEKSASLPPNKHDDPDLASHSACCINAQGHYKQCVLLKSLHASPFYYTNSYGQNCFII